MAELRSAYRPVADASLDVSAMVVSEQFSRQHDRRAAVRRREAVDALRNADAVETWDVGHGTMVHLVSATSASIGGPHRLLIEVIERPGEPPSLNHAWRLPGAAADDTPTELFAGVVARLGLPIELGRGRGLFIGSAQTPNGPSDLKVEGMTKSTVVTALLKVGPGGGASWAWTYALGPDRDASTDDASAAG